MNNKATPPAGSTPEQGLKTGRDAPFPLHFREEPLSTDIAAVREIVASTGLFYPPEIQVACDLVRERLSKGIESGYHFLFAEKGGEVVGYTCFGPVPCTLDSYDLYWIAVHHPRRGSGIGTRLLTRSERIIRNMGGTRIYVDTSSRELYRPTIAFYSASGYGIEATLEDFYAPGDAKVILLKILP